MDGQIDGRLVIDRYELHSMDSIEQGVRHSSEKSLRAG
jgi:hypothetical protein